MAFQSLTEGIAIALDSVRGNKVRASLTILGVAIGVMVVVTIAAMITGINHSVTEIFEQAGPRTFMVFRFFQAGVHISDGSDEADPWRRNPKLTPEEAKRIGEMPSIEFVVMDEGTSGEMEFEEQKLASVQVHGRGSNWVRVSGGDVFPGRSFTAIEENAGARVVVINRKLADQFFGFRDPIGRTVKIEGVPYDILGVFNPPPNLFGEGDRPEVTIPHPTMAKYLDVEHGWMDFMVSPRDSVTVQEAIDEVTTVMRTMRNLRPAQADNFSIVTQDKMLETWNQLTGVFFLVMIALSSVGLMVGGVGVVAIMMISVTERTREIGVRKALGATRREILWQFLVEASTLTLIGGAAGLVVGALIAMVISTATPIPAEVPLWSVVTALLASALTGIGFGMYPAARAARLDPVDALRYE